MGDELNAGAGPTMLEPSGSAAMPVDTTPPPAPAADAKPAEGDGGEGKEPVKSAESKVKLPPSIKPPVKSGRFQARISDLVNQRNATERENAQLRERLSRMGSTIPNPSAKPGAAPVAGKSEVANNTGEALNPEDFPTYGEYITALVTKTMEQKEEAANSQRANQEFVEHRSKRLSVFNEQAEPLAQEYGEGFWDVITDENLPVSEAMADAILELDQMGPFMMLYLAAHKDEAAKISKLNPRAATIAIGRLALRLENEINTANTAAGGAAGGDGAAAPAASTPAPATTTPAAPRPSLVPVPRGSTANLDAALPNDKDDVDTWLKKETDRLRRVNPNARFYGAR